jgi:hypothetical protein
MKEMSFSAARGKYLLAGRVPFLCEERDHLSLEKKKALTRENGAMPILVKIAWTLEPKPPRRS